MENKTSNDITEGVLSVIGMGPMGQAMARVFLNKGYRTTVWNRTPSKAEALIKEGALPAATPADALSASKLIVLSLTDYDAMYQVLNPVTALLKDRVLVNLSSDTPKKAREAAMWAAAHGAQYLAGGVMVPPPLVGQPGAYVFYSGDRTIVDKYTPILNSIGNIDYLGEDAGLAPLYYQALLDIMFSSWAGILHAVAMVRSANVSAKSFEPYIFNFLPLMPQLLQGMADEVDKAEYNGELNNMRMLKASIGHVAHTSHDININTSLPDAIHKIFEEAIGRGYGNAGLNSIIEVLQKPTLK